MSFVGRLFVVFFAFLIAAFASGLALAFGVVAPDFRGLDSDPIERLWFFGAAFIATGYAVGMALLPSAIAIALAEAARIRSVLYYALGGALIGLATFYSVDVSDLLENTTDIAPVGHGMELAAAAGIVGGLVYWLIAGRRAGAWRRPQSA
jgi:hypothetical protein